MNIAKIGLGTAQWGMSYGIANKTGQPSAETVSVILQRAFEKGISLLDTAYDYGNAEAVLGAQFVCSRGFKIVTKTRPIAKSVINKDDVLAVSTAFSESLQRLNCSYVYGLLVHSADNLINGGGGFLWDALEKLKRENKVNKIGVSVYHPIQLEKILNRYRIDLVQLPINIYDQRFCKSALLMRMKHENIEIHSRSVFLQGLLLLEPEQLPSYFNDIRSHHESLYQYIRTSGLTPLECCLRFCLEQPFIDHVLVGCESIAQLSEIINGAEERSWVLPDTQDYYLDSESIINPSLWRKNISRS